MIAKKLFRSQTRLLCLVLLTLLALSAPAVMAQTTAFTYQGKLTDAGNPANANYDLQFKLFDTATVGTGAQQGATLVRNPVMASGGVFSVQLDFGANVFGGADRYLEIGVRPVSTTDPYTVLAPRQPITASPYDIQTLNAQQLGGLPPSRFVQTDASGNVGIGTTTLTNSQLNVNGFGQDAIVGSSSFGIGVTGQGVFGGVRGFTDTNGARGVYGISLNGTGVEGSSNGSNNFAVFSNGYLGLDRLGTGGNTTMCRNASNQLATCGSSLRYKTDLQHYSGGLNVINRLQPLTYRWKSDHSLDVGFGAEAVAKIDPLLITRNDKGEVEGVKYDRLSVVFVNAFKEQQTQLQTQARHIAVQEKQLKHQQQQLDMLRKLVCQTQPQAAACQE